MRVRSPHDREILRLALPALGALAAEPLYVLVDTAIVGHLGRPQIAALHFHWGIVGLWIGLDVLIAARLALLGVRFLGRRWAVVGWG